MKKIAGFSALCLALMGCMADAGSDATQESDSLTGDGDDAAEMSDEVAETSSAIVVGCPPNAPVCDCALKGQSPCLDDDADGVLNMNDNCRYKKNPSQSDCDGDHMGDACDSEGFRVTKTGTRSYNSGYTYTGKRTCERDEGVNSIFYQEVTFESGTEDYEQGVDCFGFLVEKVTARHTSHHECWEGRVEACDWNAQGWDELGRICVP